MNPSLLLQVYCDKSCFNSYKGRTFLIQQYIVNVYVPAAIRLSCQSSTRRLQVGGVRPKRQYKMILMFPRDISPLK